MPTESIKPSTTTTQIRELEPCPRGHTGAQVCNSDERMFYVTCVDRECFWVLGEGYDRDAMPDHAFRSEEEAIEAWNTRAPSDTEQPLCPVHQSLEDKDVLELEVGNDCVACSLNERAELLNILAEAMAANGRLDSVTALRKLVSDTERVIRLREALEPLASLASGYESFDGQHNYLDTDPIVEGLSITIGDIRRARAALQPKTETEI